MSLSRLNSREPACAVSPAMMEGAAACHRRVSGGHNGGHAALPLVHGHVGALQEGGRVELQARALSPSHRGDLLASEIEYTINRDKLKYILCAVRPARSVQERVCRSCTRSLRLIPQPDKPGKMPSLQH